MVRFLGFFRFLRRIDWRDPSLWLLFLAVLYVAQAAATFARVYHFNVVDDAYISFHYAKNWVLGRGMVFNPGERVEGYTNFLWIVVLAPFYALSRGLSIDFTRVAIGLSIVIALLDLGLAYLVARRLFQRDWLATGLTVALCALDNAYVGYAAGALENHLLIFCVLAAIHVWLDQSKRAWLWTGVFLALASMTRPDAGLVAGTFGLSAVFSLLLRDPTFPDLTRRALFVRAMSALGVWALIFGAYFAWRWSYYGALLPNTFYLKVGSTTDGVERGLGYTLAFFDDRYYLQALAFLPILWIRRGVLRWLWLLVVLHGAYVIYVGGDFYSGHRFYLVLLPVLYLLVGWVVHRIRARIATTSVHRWMVKRTALAAAATGVLGGLFGYGLAAFTLRGYERGPWALEVRMWGEMVDNNVTYMRWLGTYVKPGSSMVVGDIGSAGFFTDCTIYDVYGVIDPNIAHMKVPNFGRGKAGHEKRATREYLMGRDPTYVKWGYVPGDLHAFGYYLFTEYPPGFRIEGLWVKEDLGAGYYLPETAIHFLPKETSQWRRTGTAFKATPTGRNVGGRRFVFGHVGTYIDTFVPNEGDRAMGTLTSPPIALKGDRMVLLVGGGRDPERLRVSLTVDGHRVASATGHDFEVLGRRVWDIAPYKGKTGRIEIVDLSPDGWGHILVDEIVQWVSTE